MSDLSQSAFAHSIAIQILKSQRRVSDKGTKGLPVITPTNAENLVHPKGLKSFSTVAAKTDLMVCHASGRDF